MYKIRSSKVVIDGDSKQRWVLGRACHIGQKTGSQVLPNNTSGVRIYWADSAIAMLLGPVALVMLLIVYVDYPPCTAPSTHTGLQW